MKKHYYMLCAEVTFVDPNGDTGITRCNVIADNDKPYLNVKKLARAQQGAQLQVKRKITHMEITIVNVVLISTSHIGYMTTLEFNEGMSELETEQAQRQAASIFDVRPEGNA